MKILYRAFILFTFTLLLSCKSSHDPQILSFEPPELPPINGIVWMSDTGIELGTWGSPNYGDITVNSDYFHQIDETIKPDTNYHHTIPIEISVSVPYPNPSNKDINWLIKLPHISVVSAWVVSNEFASGIINDIFTLNNGKFFSNSNKPIKTICFNDTKLPGYYSLEWDIKDFDSNDVPPGFYRIFTLIDARLFWRDVLVYKDRDDLPEFFR